jgi:rhodanese-related sulfurtransferase
MRQVPDRPGNVLVVVFPDNIFKYASSVMRHFPAMFPGDDAPAPDADANAGPYDEMVRNAKQSRDAVTIEAAKSMIDSGRTLIIDVRKPDRYAGAHVAGAINIPLAELPGAVSQLPADQDTQILCVCDRGNISANGMLYLKSLGYSNVKSLNGGTSAWIREGLPTEP